MTIEQSIKHKAIALGFDIVGITSAEPLDAAYQNYHADWLARGCADGIRHLHRNNDKRFAPTKLLDEAQSVICVGLNYRPHPKEAPAGGSLPIARYALYDDYHDFIKTRLNALAAHLQSICTKPSVRFKVCCDAMPLAERALAQRAGLGFIGRNHFLIHPTLGCQLLLGELITTLPLEPDAPTSGDFCRTCRRCIDACPTGALDENGGFDARRCISALTQGHVSDDPPVNVAGSLFGCDVCLLACPYDQAAPPRRNPELIFYPQRTTITANEVLRWTQDDFDAVFKNSCLQRVGLSHLKQIAAQRLPH